MSKFICFSFDDGRKDTFLTAIPILLKHHFTASIHVVTSFCEKGLSGTNSFLSSCDSFMSVKDCLNAKSLGFEISSHSDTHTNDYFDIVESLNKLNVWGITKFGQQVGFASPNSEIEQETIEKIIGKVSYIRVGTKVRKRRIIDILIYIINSFFHNKKLFYLFNKRYIFNPKVGFNSCLPSVTIKSNTTIKEILYLVDKMNDEEALILNFHSIIYSNNSGYKKDVWFYDAQRFDELCNILASKNNVLVLSIEDLKSHFIYPRNSNDC